MSSASSSAMPADCPPPGPRPDANRGRLLVYVLVALAALLTGYVLGLVGGDASNRGSRCDWPPPNPRALSP